VPDALKRTVTKILEAFEKLKTLFIAETQRSQRPEKQRFFLVFKWYYLRLELCALCASAEKNQAGFSKASLKRNSGK